MPAFGPTDAFREASGFPREYGAWNWQQYQDALGRMNQYGQTGDWLRDWILNRELARAQEGFDSPEAIRATGDRVTPGIEDAIGRRGARLSDISRMFDDRVSTGETMGSIFDNINGMAGDITRTGEGTQSEINDLFSRGAGREDEASGEVQRNIGDTYGRTERGVNEAFSGLRGANSRLAGNMAGALTRTFGGLRGSLEDAMDRSSGRSSGTTADLIGRSGNAFRDIGGRTRSTYGGLGRGMADTYRRAGADTSGTYGELEGSSEGTYDEAIRDAEGLRPNSALQMARVGRSFAPAVSNAKARLRRAGVGPNDLQSQAVLGEVEAARARAMDDSAAASGERAVDRLNELRLGRQGSRERLGLGRLDRSTELGLGEQAGRERLELSQLSDEERQQLAQLANEQGLSLDDMVRQINLDQERQVGRERLGVNEFDRGRSIGEGELERDISLGVGQSDRVTRAGEAAGAESRNETLRRLAAMQGLDIGRTNATIGNLDTQYGRTQDWRNQGNTANLMRRALETQDFDTRSNLAREQNQEELTNIDLRNLGYDRGQDWTRQNRAVQDSASSNIANVMARLEALQQDQGRTANMFGNAAADNYARAYEQEAGKGGWASRLLLGGLGAFLGDSVAGGALAGARGQPTSGTQQGGGAFQFAGGTQGGGSPYNINWAMPFLTARNTQQNQQATAAGMARGIQSQARVAPGQQAQQPWWQAYGSDY